MRSALQKTAQQLLAYGVLDTAGTKPADLALCPEKGLRKQRQGKNPPDDVPRALGR